MATSGPNYTTTWSSTSSTPYDDDAWLNVTNLGSASTLATITAATYDSPDYSYLAVGTGFGFAIPEGCTINGVTVEINGRYDAGTASIAYVALHNSGSVIGTAKTTDPSITSSLATYTFGSTSDTWGATLTPSVINSTTFGVRFSVQADSANTDISFDWARITVTYTPDNRSASSTFKVQLPIISSTATNTPPARSASTTFRVQPPIIVGTATNTNERNASSAFKIQTPILSSSATNVPPARSASSTFKVQTPLFSGSATNVPPARSASGEFELEHIEISGTATNVPPARDASGGVKVQLPLIGGSATNALTRTGSGGVKVQLVLATGAATNVPPPREAAGVLRLQSPLLSGSAEAEAALPRDAAGSIKMQSPTISGMAIHDEPRMYASVVSTVVFTSPDSGVQATPLIQHSDVASANHGTINRVNQRGVDNANHS